VIWHTVTNVAERLQVPADKVRSWIKSGILDAVDVSDNPGRGKPRYRISDDSLEAFLAAREAKPPTKAKRGKTSPGRKYV